MKRKIRLTILSAFLLFSLSAIAQVSPELVVSKKNQGEMDSLKNSDYLYSLPIWGKKVTALGYKFPYSGSLGINYLWQKSDLLIENLNVGFNGGQMYNVDNIVRFNNSTAEANIVNIRPDLWILLFLNVYGIVATSKPLTAVGFGIWIPDTSNNFRLGSCLQEPKLTKTKKVETRTKA